MLADCRSTNGQQLFGGIPPQISQLTNNNLDNLIYQSVSSFNNYTMTIETKKNMLVSECRFFSGYITLLYIT